MYKPAAPDASAGPVLARIPSTREDVFSSTDLPARAKRQLMKFLKLVLSYEEESSLPQWQAYAERPLAEFLADKMGLENELRTYIITLTLSFDGRISTKKGLGTIHRHLTSMGLFGPGFAAVYPKWGGGSEIAQVACRAGAVGGGIYMLGSGIKTLKSEGAGEELVELELSDGTVVKTKMLVRGSDVVPEEGDLTTVSIYSHFSRLPAHTRCYHDEPFRMLKHIFLSELRKQPHVDISVAFLLIPPPKKNPPFLHTVVRTVSYGY